MIYTKKRSDKQIEEVLNATDEQESEGGSQWRGMTYEQGVAAGIRWILGLSDDNPMEDE